MSEENIPSGKTAEAGGDGGKNQVSYDSYAKLLNEKKNLQKQYEEARTTKEQYEQEKLEAEGKLKEANDNLKRRVQESEDRFKGLFQKVTLKSFKSEFSREAEKIGCVDPELAYLACDMSDVEVNDDIEFNKETIQKKVEELSKVKPHLFRKDVRAPNDMSPSANQPQNKNLNELSEAELKQLLARAK